MTRINSLLAAAAIAMSASTPAVSPAFNTSAPPQSRRKGQNAGRISVARRRSTTLHPMNGAKECARRLRQIEAGTLRVSD